MSQENLITAANLAKELGVSPKKVKDAIAGLGIEPDVKKGVCSYYNTNSVEKIKTTLNS